jgi:hypothetical protein
VRFAVSALLACSFGCACALACGCEARDLATSDAGAGAGGAVDSAGAFVAEASDFDAFRSWPEVALGMGPNPADPPGPRFGFVKNPPSSGVYPVGSIVVKAIERTPVAQDWDVLAMVKRGGWFNPSGARDWEYFLLRVGADEHVAILSRGIVLEDATPDGGASYGSTGAIFCDGCHAARGAEAHDYILSPALQP